ncbi:hypothetical protein QTN25_001171 [Entamoeba marina]
MIVSKYFNTETDFINAIQVNSKHMDLLDKFHYNPIPQTRLFKNIQTQYLYSPIDKRTPTVDHYVICYDVYYNEYIQFPNDTKCLNITYTRDDYLEYNLEPFETTPLKKIHNRCFEHYHLDNLVLPTTVSCLGKGCFTSSAFTKLLLPIKLVTIEDNCFNGCYQLTGVTFSEVLREIGDAAFYGCYKLKELILPDMVLSLGESCFEHCELLSYIHCSSSLEVINNRCFASCKSLHSIKLPTTLRYLGNNSFSGCTNLTLIECPRNSNLVIGFQSYSSYTLLDDDMKQQITTISLSPLELRNLNFQIPTSVQIRLDDYCYSKEYHNPSTVNIPTSVISIGNFCFNRISDVKSVVIPTSVTSIGQNCFNYCNAITSLQLPTTIQSIGSYSFCNCTKCLKPTIPTPIKFLGTCCFIGFKEPKEEKEYQTNTSEEKEYQTNTSEKKEKRKMCLLQ